MAEPLYTAYEKMKDDQMERAIVALQDVKQTYGYRLLMADIEKLRQEALDSMITEKDPIEIYRHQGAIVATDNLIDMADAMVEHMQVILTERQAEKEAARIHAQRRDPNIVR